MEPEPEPEPEPKPEVRLRVRTRSVGGPGRVNSSEVPEGKMADWTEEGVRGWTRSISLSVLEIEVKTALSDLDGYNLKTLRAKDLEKKLVKASATADARARVIQEVLDLRDQWLNQEGSLVPTRPPPSPETRNPRSWRSTLKREGLELRTALQEAAETWKPKRWDLSEELGRGSSGVVFRSSDKVLGEVAIKFTVAEDEDAEKLVREANLMKRVKHPNICGYHEHYISDGGLCGMVIEFLNTGTLRAHLNESEGGRMREPEVTRMAFSILDALACMHEKNVIHRDIKPTNIVLHRIDGRQVYKVIDLSIAAIEEAGRAGVSTTMATGTTTLKAAVGTAHYMSPEQIKENVIVTHQTDLFSLGVMLYEALSGVLPFAPDEQDKFKIANVIVNENPLEISDAVEEVGAVSDGMAEFTMRALQKDLEQRFSTAAEMIAALEKLLHSSTDGPFGLFISYRVWCDKEFAEALYMQASKCELRPGGRENRLQVYLDKVCMVDGRPFDENFVNAMANSKVFTPLLSKNCLRSLVELGETDKEDFVLMEWIIAIELQKRQIVKAIFPIAIEMQDKGQKDGQKDGVAGLYSQSFVEQLRDGKVKGKLENGVMVDGDDSDTVELADVVSAKSTAKAREFLQMLDPPVELSAELTVKEVVLKLLTFQAVFLHFENDDIDSLESVKLARIDSTHGTRAKAVARKHVAHTCAERILKVVEMAELEPEPEPLHDESACTAVPEPSQEAQPMSADDAGAAAEREARNVEPEPEIKHGQPETIQPGPHEQRHIAHLTLAEPEPEQATGARCVYTKSRRNNKCKLCGFDEGHENHADQAARLTRTRSPTLIALRGSHRERKGNFQNQIPEGTPPS